MIASTALLPVLGLALVPLRAVGGWFAMREGQLLLQPGVVLAAGTLHVSNNSASSGICKGLGWQLAGLGSQPWQGTSQYGLCSVSFPSSVLEGCPCLWDLLGCSRTQCLGKGTQHPVQRSENQCCPRGCVNPCSMSIHAPCQSMHCVIHTPLSRSGYGPTLPAAVVAKKGPGCCREESSQGIADASI